VAKPKHKHKRQPQPQQIAGAVVKSQITLVDSLLDSIIEGKEFSSLVQVFPKPHVDLMAEFSRSLHGIEVVRGRPCLAYVGSVAGGSKYAAIDSTDDLPFAEMIANVPSSEKKVDILLATLGGSGQQVNRFVNCLRPRFDEVNFLIPSLCMSAGTLFALSGDSILMSERACLGPIDPQIPTKDGRFVPAQALLLLVESLQKTGEDGIKKGIGVPWTAVRLIDSLDKKELGDAMTATSYSATMATQFLMNYKLKNWTVRETTGVAVTPDYREQRATEIAVALASHDRWKSHGHAITREVLWSEIRLRIDLPDTALDRAIKRAWALLNWMFEKAAIFKVLASQNYRYMRFGTQESKTND